MNAGPPVKNPRTTKRTGWYVRFKSPFYPTVQTDYWGAGKLSTVMMLEQINALKGLGLTTNHAHPYWYESFYVYNGIRMP